MSTTEISTQTQTKLGFAILLLVFCVAMALLLHGPINQPANYHHFADQRNLFGIPHFMDVISNLPFLLVGAWGLRYALLVPEPSTRRLWCAFFFAVSCTCFGSAFYHWSPDNFGLMIDRLPIAWACAWLTCALLADRFDVRVARPVSLLLAFVLSTLSVLYWHYSPQASADLGDLRPYLTIQFLPLLLVPLCVGFTARSGKAFIISGKQWAVVLGLYAIAKGFEVADHVLYAQLQGFLSGHTLKHLLAAAAAGYLAHALSVAKQNAEGKIR